MLKTFADGRYELIEEIGSTRICSVFQAVDTIENRHVAIKLVRGEGSDEQELMAAILRLRQEAQILASLKHPNVINLEKVGISEGRIYLVLPFLKGHTLMSEIAEARGMDFRRAAAVAMQVADALSYVHGKGILHLDIKPSNIFILKSTEVKDPQAMLLDFGLSRLRSLILRERPDEMVGSAAYMSPEQTGILERPVDQRSDLYSLGITLYQMVTGCLPLVARDLPTLLHKQIAEEPTPPSKVVPSVPRPLEEIILKLLRKDSGERYLTAEGLREDLLQFIKLADNGRENQLFTLQRKEARGRLNLDPQLQGREQELESFKEILSSLPAEEGDVIFIEGEIGVGKSRLSQEYLKLGLKKQMLLLAGQCTPWLKEQPCQLLLDMLAPFEKTLNSFPKEQKAQMLKGFQQKGRSYENFTELVSELLRAWSKLSEFPHVDPLRLQRDIFSSLYAFLEAIAGETNGIIVFVDDLHWADEGSLRFLNYLASQASGQPILLIGTLCPDLVDTRSELRNTIAGFKLNHLSFPTQKLGPLNFEQSVKVIADVLCSQPEEISSAISRHIFKVTKGNPLFLIEYLKSAIEVGILSFEDETWRLDRLPQAEAALPRTLAETLANRLGRLKPETREILSYASILGLKFTLDSLKHLSGKESGEFISLLDEARDSGLVTERGIIGGGGYTFTHQQILDAVYNSINPETRRHLHETAGKVLEERNNGALDRVAFELSKHFYLGYSHDKAFRYSLLSASLARSRCSFKEALFYLERALTLFPSYESEEVDEQWLDIHIKSGEACYRLGIYKKAIACFQEAIRFSRDSKQTAVLRSYIGSILFRKGSFRDALRYHEQALLEYGFRIPTTRLMLLVNIGYQMVLRCLLVFLSAFHKPKADLKKGSTLPERIRLYSQTSYVCFFMGDLARTLWCNLKQLNMSVFLGESEQLAQAYSMHGLICSQMGLFRRAEKFIEKSRMINEKLVSRSWGIAQCLSYLGYCLLNQGRSNEAISNLVKSVEIWRAVGDPLELGYTLRFLAWSYIFIGDLHKADSAFAELISLSEKVEDKCALADGWNGKAWVSVMMGKLNEAIEYAKQTLAILASAEVHTPQAVAHQILGMAYYYLGDLKRAKMELEESLTLIEKHKLVPSMHSLTFAWLAEACLIDKDKLSSLTAKERETELRKIHHLCLKGIKQAGRIKRFKAENIRSLALYHALRGKDNKASSCFGKAESVLQAQGYKYELARTYRFHGEFLLSRNHRLSVEYLQKALNLFTDIMAPHEIKITGELLGEEWRESAKRVEEKALEPAQTSLVDASTLESLFKLGHEITSILDLDQLLVKIVDLANQVVGAERGFLLLKNGDVFKVKVARYFNKKSIDPDEYEVSWGVIKKVARDQNPLLIADAQAHRELQEKDSIQAYDLRSVACVPIKLKGKFSGIVYVDNRFTRGLFTDKHLKLLNMFAFQAAVALENATLYKKVEEAEQRAIEENRYLKRDFVWEHRFANIIGEDPRFQGVLDQLEQAAQTELNVLIQGETGTGKGLIARAIHAHSPRADKVFVEQNCAALPENLLESEIFGYKKGAFTGAVSDKKGLLEAADRGTLFLDEIAETTPAIQAKLLRVIEGQSFRRLGDTVKRKVDVRIIAATNRDLATEMKEDRFRADLYYRLNNVRLYMPPLRERKGDKQLLIRFFLDKFCKEAKKEIKGLTPEAMRAIEEYPFPGNVRELENEIRRAVWMTKSSSPIGVGVLSPEIREKAAPLKEEGALPSSVSASELPLKNAVQLFEKKFIEDVLKECQGNISRAAEKLGISRYGLYKKMQKLMPEKAKHQA